ncbi:MAG: ABC transporter substrate-binding protein [Eubacterium sp.]|nr:ABC transporter substrate-binding protein [Eubacterium sp.]
MNKTVKKVLGIGLAVAMVGGIFAACTNGGTSEETTAANGEGGKTFNVGICQLVQHEALDAATKGFQEKLTELAEADGNTVNFDVQNASGESANCTTIINQFVSNNSDLIMANATPALQAAANATASNKIPVVGTSVTDYGTALELKLAAGEPTGINVTGVSDLASLEEQANQITTLFPEAKKVGCIYCSAEANSTFQVEGIKAALDKSGIETTFYSFADSNDIQAVAKKAASESDVIYIPTDNTAASNGQVIDVACQEANVPIIAGEEGIFKNTNAVATFSISYYDIGVHAGEMAYEILSKGTDPATMPIWQPTDLTYYVNEDMANKYNVTVPDNYTAYDFSAAE